MAGAGTASGDRNIRSLLAAVGLVAAVVPILLSTVGPAAAQAAVGAAAAVVSPGAVPGNGQDKHLEAIALLRSGDASGAVAKLSSCVALDDPVCMNDLAWMLQHGVGVPVSLESARTLYRKAATAGVARAMNQIAWMTERGLGGRRDPDGAFALYKAAAERGFGPAIRNMAECLRTGIGTQPDPVQATRWDRIADTKDEPAALAGTTRESAGGALASALADGGFRTREEPIRTAAPKAADTSERAEPKPLPAPAPKGEPAGADVAKAERAAAFWRSAVDGAGRIEAKDPAAPSAGEVVALAEKAAETDPSVAAHWHMLGYARAKLVGGAEAVRAAEADLGRALALSPDLWQARLLLADVLRTLGRDMEAEAALSRAEASGGDAERGAAGLRAKWGRSGK